MPEESSTDNDLKRLLDDLEDYTINEQNYLILQNTLDAVDRLTAPTVENLLSLCIGDRIEDLKFATQAVNIIATLLKKKQKGQCTTLPDLVPSALAVLNILKRSAIMSTVETLKTLCFYTLISYPDETLINLCVHHSDKIYELIQIYCHQLIPAEIRVEPVNLLSKLLRILPPDKKLSFVKDGIKVWFIAASTLIPRMATSSNIVPNLLEALELLTDQLVQFDYTDNEDWLNMLEHIYKPERFPYLMIRLLEEGSPHWHQLWIIFIKLLKSQLTKCSASSASPINALLPCVEKAFKMQVPDRCRAFLCWNVLVNNFSKEANEALLNKRLKLLMIPLAANNAKVEETALAKFETWWNLIARFQTRMDKFSEMVIIPFLNHCFGKPTSNTSDLILGKISEKTKVQCVQGFINIVGHTKCEGCVPLPKLNVKVLNTKLLESHWKDWIHSLSSSIRICVEQHGEFSDKQIQCVWISFILTIAELPENNMRRDIFNETLTILEGLTQECDNRLMHVIVNVLVPSLFEGDEQIQALLKLNNEHNAPFHKIVAVLNKLPLDGLEDRKTVIKNMKMLTDWMVDDTFKTSSTKLEWFVKTLSSNDVLLWTAIAESIAFRVYTACPLLLAKMLLWPFNFMDNFVTKEESTRAWFDLYKTLYPYLPMREINKDIVNTLFIHSDNQLTHVFVLNATIAVLEQKVQVDEDTDFDKDVVLILHLTSKMSDAQLKSTLPSLAGVIVHILTILNKTTNIMIADNIIFIINNILKVFNALFLQQPSDDVLLKCIENIFNALESTFQIELYSRLKVNLVDQLKACAPNLIHENSLNNHIFAIYKKSLNEIVEDSNANQIQNKKKYPVKLNSPRGNVAKKSNKEVSIINTVVENGEEFAVIKPNYKFNPRKLTDNQKEKLQRKREDIPALYQDLSQSQDEFKLNTWKMDSQDTTTTSSKSTNAPSNDDMSAILKNIPNSEFVPKIIENVVKPADRIPEIEEEYSKVRKCEKNNVQNVQKKIKDAKSPRIALKDRIFRNKRNLMDNYQNDDSNVNFSNTEHKTPLMQKIKASSNITMSAPSQINPERPSRIKRKPKKFDDEQLIPQSKKRLSLNSEHDVNVTENQNEMSVEFLNEDQTDTGNKDKVKNVHSQDIIDIAPTTVISDDTNTLEQHEKDKLVERNTMTRNDSVAAENLKPKKAVGLKAHQEEKRDAKNTVLSALVLNYHNEINQIINLDDINNIQQNHEKDKIKEIMEENNGSDDLKLNKVKEKKRSVDTNNTEKITPKTKKEDCNVIEQFYSNQSKSTTIPSLEKIYQDNSKIDLPSKSGDKTQKVKEKMCPSDINTNTPVDEVIGQQTLSHKKSNTKKSRIESQLAIDMVEGHPLLKVQPEKRSTRKIVNSPSNAKLLSSHLDYTKHERKAAIEAKNKIQEKKKGKSTSSKASPNTGDISASQDFIESSQDSDVTTISVKPSIPIANQKPIVLLKQLDIFTEAEAPNIKVVNIHSANMESNCDIELPCNKTNLNNLTEEMDTQPIDAVIDLCFDEDPSTSINFEGKTNDPTLEQDTEKTAEVDTQLVDPDMLLETAETDKTYDTDHSTQMETTENDKIIDDRVEVIVIVENNENASVMQFTEDVTKSLSESVLVNSEKEDLSSSCNNEQRKKDFIDDTLQISPIKSMSPIRDQKSPSPETSSDYDLIKFASPVQSNGEPFETCESPEIFTEDKVSPDKRDQSPPREEVCVKNTSPSSSLSLKKNRPQMRPGGRAAQMLGMCVSNRLQSEKPTEVDEVMGSPSLNSTARRNLKNLYNSSSYDNSDDTEENDIFLKFKRTLPSTDCSPAGPILKRKLIDITDESTASPASKRKRVSFHDPPVSTTICVKKYIESIGVRSPQNSANKRLERQNRAQAPVKSPRRLDNVFKLDSVLTKAVESFSDVNETQNMTEDTEMSSLDETPVIEVVKTSDLNDTDPICTELVDCEDHIEHIAAELSSPAMKALLVKKFEGKVETIGDLAKMTELEVNRLCIKAPKVQMAKKVLNEYLRNIKRVSEETTPTVEAELNETTVPEVETSVEVQTDSTSVQSIEMQTEDVAVALACSQTDSVLTSHTFVQTDELKSKSTAEAITECLTERSDFVETLLEGMDEPFKQRIAENLSIDSLLKIIMDKLNNSDGRHVSSILDFIGFCSRYLKRVHIELA